MRPHGQENWKMYSISPMLTLRRYLVIQIKQPNIFQFDKNGMDISVTKVTCYYS